MRSKTSNIRRNRRHGFRSRTANGGGVLARRRSKGRKALTHSTHSKYL